MVLNAMFAFEKAGRLPISQCQMWVNDAFICKGQIWIRVRYEGLTLI